MKKYAVKIVYFDMKEVQIVLEEKQVPDFLKCIKKGEAYWEPTQQVAFWTPTVQVRYINIIEVMDKKENAPAPAQEEIPT